jgi:shikimate kinase
MILELNGLAGVGKFTIGRILARALNARLVDNHTIYNPAFASTPFRSTAFYETVRAVRTITFGQLEKLPPEASIILTIAPGTELSWGREWQEAIRQLATKRETTLLGVHLLCDSEEWALRISSPSRELMRKLVEPSVLDDGVERPVLLDHCDAPWSWMSLFSMHHTPLRGS